MIKNECRSGMYHTFKGEGDTLMVSEGAARLVLAGLDQENGVLAL